MATKQGEKITWFNPPWNSAVKTNIGKQFLRIIDTSFPPGNPLRKLFNRSTVKVSYKCMPNMSSLVSSHNVKLLQKDDHQQQPQGCNCQGGPHTCPLTPAECQKDNVIYVATGQCHITRWGGALYWAYLKYIQKEMDQT